LPDEWSEHTLHGTSYKIRPEEREKQNIFNYYFLMLVKVEEKRRKIFLFIIKLPRSPDSDSFQSEMITSRHFYLFIYLFLVDPKTDRFPVASENAEGKTRERKKCVFFAVRKSSSENFPLRKRFSHFREKRQFFFISGKMQGPPETGPLKTVTDVGSFHSSSPRAD
jgi:hypothetical protein